MPSLLRNIVGGVLFCAVLLSALQCGSGKEKKEVAVSDEKTYKNLDSNVKYVGITACRQCHYDKYETFIETGMGKSFDKATKKKSSAKFDAHSVVYDKYSDLTYHPYWSGDTMKIMEFRLNGKDTVHKRIETVDYIIGSGHHTNSHIFNTNGYLHQMPMTFYTQDGKWDLPPGFEGGFNSRFSRKIGLECMSCHNALPDFVQESENKFSEVPSGISCERCHGPGEAHVKEKTAGIVVDTSKYIDYSIVNPAKLPINLQFDVCQRCHLQGNSVLKEGKSFMDFRPGMKLSDVETIFLPKYEGADDEFIMASHADRLKMSKCFLQTEAQVKPGTKANNSLRPYKGGLTCVTCHNPHVSVKVTGKEVFNNACNKCHTSQTNGLCTEKPEVRAKKQDNCVSCHMPRSGSIDIPHVTVTDHYIRKPVKKADMAAVKKFIGLVAINEKDPSPEVRAQAYINQYEKFDHNPVYLDSAMKHVTDNFNLMVRIHFLKNELIKIIQMEEGRAKSKTAGTQHFDAKDSWTWYRIAEAYQSQGDLKKSLEYYKKACELKPFNLDFQNKYAGTLAAMGNTGEAENVYKKILSENSKFPAAYCNLGYIYLTRHDFIKADENFNKALALDPDYEQALLNKAQMYYVNGDMPKTRELLKRVLKINPKHEKAKMMLEAVNKNSKL